MADRRRAGCAVACAVAALFAATPARAASSAAEVYAPVTPAVFDGDLRDLAPAVAAPAALQGGAPSVDENFAGQGFSSVRPPNPVGDVGPSHYIQAINAASGSTIVVYAKSGTPLTGPVAMDTLASGGPCATGFGDPSVLWDPLADRWLLAEFTSTNNFCVYVSRTADPIAGGWYRYAFATPQFPDFPVLAVWPDAYVVTTSESDPAVYALDRAAMLAGETATQLRFPAAPLDGFGFQSLTPADLDAAQAPPTGSPAFLLRHVDDEAHDPGGASPSSDHLDVYELRADFTAPSFSFERVQSIPIAEFSSNLCGLVSIGCIPQPGTATLLDPRRELVMNRVAYRRFASHEALVGSFVTNVDLSGATTRAAVRWFELRRVAGGDWTLHQEGTHSPDAHARWVPAIAMNGDQHVAVGYSVSSATLFPGLRWAGRLRSDPLGTLGAENALIEGAAAQTGSARWGDHFAMSVDPADDCTFWFSGEWMTASSNQWATRIGAFRVQECPEASAAAFAALLTLGAIASRAAAARPGCAPRAHPAPARAAARRTAVRPRRDRRS
jgi:hypothetical protein